MLLFEVTIMKVQFALEINLKCVCMEWMIRERIFRYD